MRPMMPCPDLGTWRAWLDQAAPGDAAELAHHLAVCLGCQSAVQELRDSATVAESALATMAPASLPSPAQVAQARQRLAARLAADRPVVAPIAANSSLKEARLMRLFQSLSRHRVALGGLAAALVVTAAATFTSPGRAATAQFLAQFRSERFTVVTIDPRQGGQPLSQLALLGTVSGDPDRHRAREVRSLEEASRLVGFTVKQPDPSTLPAGIAPSPRIQVMQGTEFRFTFDKDKASRYFASIGRPEVSLPDRFDGATIVVNVPAAVLLSYDGENSVPGLIIGQAGALSVGVEGEVTLDELREFLLGLPGLPPDAVKQLRNIKDWRSTLPVPVPVDSVNWTETTIAGSQGLLLNDNSGLGSAALWQRDGRIYGVAGPLKADDLRRVADSLR